VDVDKDWYELSDVSRVALIGSRSLTSLWGWRHREVLVECKAQAAFESIESAQEYLALLAQTVLEAKKDNDIDIDSRATTESPRHVEALRMISYNLEKLERHVKMSRRILNDLRTLRRLLHQERQSPKIAV
jgi:hypothetical protein